MVLLRHALSCHKRDRILRRGLPNRWYIPLPIGRNLSLHPRLRGHLCKLVLHVILAVYGCLLVLISVGSTRLLICTTDRIQE